MRHIALYSSSPQQGKSTAAGFLCSELRYCVLSFAQPLLDMIEVFLSHHGLSKNEIHYYCKTAKEQPIPGVGRSYRHLARTLGTQWGRDVVRTTTWLDIFEKKFEAISKKHFVCIDDLRFRNEAFLLKQKGFALVQIRRKTDRPRDLDNHQSDVDLAEYNAWDHIIDNTGTIEDLYQAVAKIANPTNADSI